MESLYLVISLGLMLAGLVGTVFPVLPSIPLIYGAWFLYGLGTGWAEYGLLMMILMGAITLFVLMVDFLAGALGARKFGASMTGMIGSTLGGVAGMLFFNFPGMIAGIFVGAVAGELYLCRTSEDALRAGFGAFAGYVVGCMVKLAAAVGMVTVFVVTIL